MTELVAPLCLPEIRLLDVSKNGVENISPDFLSGCPKLETLSASANRICENHRLVVTFKNKCVYNLILLICVIYKSLQHIMRLLLCGGNKQM